MIELSLFILHVVEGFDIIKQTKDIAYIKKSFKVKLLQNLKKNSTGQLSNLLFLANPSEHSLQSFLPM